MHQAAILLFGFLCFAIAIGIGCLILTNSNKQEGFVKSIGLVCGYVILVLSVLFGLIAGALFIKGDDTHCPHCIKKHRMHKMYKRNGYKYHRKKEHSMAPFNSQALTVKAKCKDDKCPVEDQSDEPGKNNNKENSNKKPKEKNKDYDNNDKKDKIKDDDNNDNHDD